MKPVVIIVLALLPLVAVADDSPRNTTSGKKLRACAEFAASPYLCCMISKYITLLFHLRSAYADDLKVRPSREYMQKYEVAHLDDKAVCNDGSSGVYYHRIGSPLNSTRHGARLPVTSSAMLTQPGLSFPQ